MSGIRRIRRRWAPALGAVVLAVAAAVTTTHAAVPRAVGVGIQRFKYGPATITVPVGGTVTWTNHDEEIHTVTSASGAFASAGLDHDERFTQTFKARGTYDYCCALHPRMKGRVIVR